MANWKKLNKEFDDALDSMTSKDWELWASKHIQKTTRTMKQERQIVFDKYEGKCAYCGCELKKGWHVDHIEPIVRDFKYNKHKSRFEQAGTCRKPQNENLENYNPSCASCNIQKNSFSIEQFRNNIKQFVHSLNQYSTQYKFAKRYGLVTETNMDVKFYFETLNQQEQ